MNPETQQPKLANPGAGLPFFEKIISRYFLLPAYYKKTSWEDAEKVFDREGLKMLTLAKNLDQNKLGKPVLIKRIR